MNRRLINIIIVSLLFGTFAFALNVPRVEATMWSGETRLTNYLYFDGLPSITQTSDKRVWILWQRDLYGYYSIMSRTYNGTDWSDEETLITSMATSSDTGTISNGLSSMTSDADAEMLQSSTYNLTIHEVTGGTTDPPAGNHTYSSGTNVTVTAFPNVNYVFNLWVIEPFPTEWLFRNKANPVNITMDNNYSLTPSFSSTAPPIYMHTAPSITQLSNGTIMVVWSAEHESNYELYYITSSDNGLNWTDYKRLTDCSADDLSPAVMQAKNGTIWVAWSSQREGNYDIYYKTFNGTSWSPTPIQFTTDSKQDKLPSITQTKDGRIWLAWCSNKVGNYELYYKTYNGITWSNEYRLTEDSNIDIDPTVFQLRNGTIWVTWSSCGTSPSADDDIYYIVSNDNGNTWSPTPIQFTTDSNEDSWPTGFQSIQREIWIAWTSNRAEQPDGNWEIWYQKTIMLEGDVNEDGKVDIEDLVIVGLAWATYPGHPKWNAIADLNDDGFIDIEDLATVGRNYGKTL